MAVAVRFGSYGGPEVLELVEVEQPTPAVGEVLVEVRAAGVNPADWKVRRGARATEPLSEPRGLGSDAAGVVVGVGAEVEDRSIGDEVILFGAPGSYASHVVAPVEQTLPKPAELGWEQAAAIGIPTGTAFQALESLGLREGETLLVHAGGGGVGQAAVQFAVLRGAAVVATASPPSHERLRALGAVPVEYGAGLQQRVEAAAPQGIDAVFDAAGTDEALEVSLALVDDRSRIGTIVDMGWVERAGVRGWSAGRPGFLTPEERQLRRDGIATAVELAAAGRFGWEIAATYPLSEAAEAHRASESGHVRGKIVLTP